MPLNLGGAGRVAGRLGQRQALMAQGLQDDRANRVPDGPKVIGKEPQAPKQGELVKPEARRPDKDYKPPSMKKGGIVPRTGTYTLHKGEQVIPVATLSAKKGGRRLK